MRVSPMMTTAQEFREVLLELRPEQGHVSEEEYFWLPDHTRRLLEYTDGYVEVLPMPTSNHQRILFLFARAFFALLDPRGGIVLFAPLRLWLRTGKYREPDLLVLLDAA